MAHFDGSIDTGTLVMHTTDRPSYPSGLEMCNPVKGDPRDCTTLDPHRIGSFAWRHNLLRQIDVEGRRERH